MQLDSKKGDLIMINGKFIKHNRLNKRSPVQQASKQVERANL